MLRAVHWGEGTELLKDRTTFESIFTPAGRVVGPFCLLLSIVLPPDGIGIDLCPFHRLWGLPCPGCGLTRSITSLTHGNFQQAGTYHPFGPIIYIVLVALTLYSLVPASARARIAEAAVRREDAIRPAFRLFVICFVSFGLARIALALLARTVL